jgi:hypothetical protein
VDSDGHGPVSDRNLRHQILGRTVGEDGGAVVRWGDSRRCPPTVTSGSQGSVVAAVEEVGGAEVVAGGGDEGSDALSKEICRRLPASKGTWARWSSVLSSSPARRGTRARRSGGIARGIGDAHELGGVAE